jgi:hypothetical protein
MNRSSKRILVLTSTLPEHNDSSQPDFVLQLSKCLGQDFNVTILAPDQTDTNKIEHCDGLLIMRFRYWIKRYQTLSGTGGILVRLRQSALRALLIPCLWRPKPWLFGACSSNRQWT